MGQAEQLELMLWDRLHPDHQMFGRTVPCQNHSHWEVFRQRVSKWKPDFFRRRKRGVQPFTAEAVTWVFFSLVKWMHMLETLQRNLQFCQVSQECLWQVFVWNIFWRLEHLCSVCTCISCKLVSSTSREGMSQALGQISCGTHTDFTLSSLLAPVLPFFWLVAPANSNLYIKLRCFSMGCGQQTGLDNKELGLEKKSGYRVSSRNL